MSLSETSVIQVAKKLFDYKLKAYVGLFFSLVVVQVFALLFSMNGVMQSGFGSGALFVNTSTYSGDVVITFTMLWAFIAAITLTTKDLRNNDFMFVSNRTSTSLANIVFFLLLSIVGAMTATLGSVLVRVVVYFTHRTQYVTEQYFFLPPNELLLTMYVTAFYLLLLCALGYLAGMLVQVNKIFIVLLPSVVVGYLMLEQGRQEVSI
ncbi:MAG: hypothetical protein LRY73_02540 [Bacillus sp. (in: Bacteria)]|nr:hypothetical protein [Bacillus sp. (in: firmicutes)]